MRLLTNLSPLLLRPQVTPKGGIIFSYAMKFRLSTAL